CDRRPRGAAARRARRGRDGRADADDRAREHAVALQLCGGPREPGILRRVRAAARSIVGDMTADEFTAHRGLLLTIAYEIHGSVSDAEDVVQESWIRWNDADRAGVREPRAYLARVVTRQALNRLRTIARRREEYVGP